MKGKEKKKERTALDRARQIDNKSEKGTAPGESMLATVRITYKPQ